MKKNLSPFVAKCAAMGKPLQDICLEEAYPGDKSTSYIVKIKANWIGDSGMDCSEALGFMYDLLIETVKPQTIEKIFSILLSAFEKVTE